MILQTKTEEITFSEIIPDIIPDEKKPMEPIFFEDYEESDEDEGYFDASKVIKNL